MRAIILALVCVFSFPVIGFGQDCSNGQCSAQKGGPIRKIVNKAKPIRRIFGIPRNK